MKHLPQTGQSKEAIFSQLEAMRQNDLDWRAGRTFAYVYDPGEEIRQIAKEAYGKFLTENALDPTVVPSLMRLENELVGLGLAHTGAPSGAAGMFTSGGTESILLAVRAACERLRRERGVEQPNIVLPITAHAAFHKAARYFGAGLRLCAIDAEYRAIPEALDEAIDDNTALVVASAPSYGHGVLDPIPAIGALALARGVPLHVDACVGGFLLPYWRRLGAKLPDWDFSVPGVTSLSMDLHKYAYTPKGASLVLFRDKAMRAYAWFACARWTGYSLINTTVLSTRSGGPLAAAWAVLHALGDSGYLEMARRMKAATEQLVAGVSAIDGLRLLVPPDFCLFAFDSERADIFHIIDEMRQRRWYIQPQLSFGGHRANIHLSVSLGNTGAVGPFLADLAEAARAAEALGSARPADELLALVQAAAAPGGPGLPALFEALGMGGGVPERMAMVNGLLEALPPELREQAILAYVNELFSGA